MISALIGAVFVAFLTGGSALFAVGHILAGLTFMGLGATGLGTMFAAVKSSAPQQPEFYVDSRDGLTVRQLQLFLGDATPDTRVYVGSEGLHLAAGAFSCQLDGGRAIVIERKAEEEEMLTVIHPFAEEVR